jgi:phosphocarrier protein
MIEQSFTLINKLGMHARAAARLVETAQTFNASVSIVYGEIQANGKSIMSVLILAAPCGSELFFQTDGPEEIEAMQAIGELINNRFDESE